MSGYTKLFQSILDSTIWCEDDKTRLVWITMLAKADRNGLVEAAIPGLANAARVSVADCEKAIKKFLEPDEYSRTPDFEGRRIEKADGGWRLLNHAKYRAKLSKEDRNEYQRRKQADYREEKRSKPLKGELEAIKATTQKEYHRKVTEHLPESLQETAAPYAYKQS